MCCHSLLLVELSTCYVTVLGKDPWKLVAGFLKTLPHVLFLFTDFALFHFTVINLSCEYYCMLNPVKSKSGTLDTTPMAYSIISSLCCPTCTALRDSPLPFCRDFTGFQCMLTTSIRPPLVQQGRRFIRGSSQPGVTRPAFCSSFPLFCYFLFNSE